MENRKTLYDICKIKRDRILFSELECSASFPALFAEKYCFGNVFKILMRHSEIFAPR